MTDPKSTIKIGNYVAAGCDYLQVSCGIGEFNDMPLDESLPYNKIAALEIYV